MNRQIKIEEYKRIYEEIVKLSMDADSFGLFANISDRDVEKCKWFAAMLEVLQDVPQGRVKHIFTQKKVCFEYIAFLDENE